MKYDEFLKNMEHETYAPVYFFYGEEEYQKEEAIGLLTGKLVDPGTKDFNFDVLYAGETDAGVVIDIASSFPMMAERRLVIYRDIHKTSPGDRKALLRYVAEPCPSTCLILVCPKVDLRKGFYRDLNTSTAAVVFWPLYDNQVPGWIRKQVQDRKRRITPQALRLLQDFVGISLQDLVNEIDKLVTYIAARDTIDETDVRDVVGRTKSQSIFELADSVAKGEFLDSMRSIRALRESGESEGSIIWALTRHFSTLTKVLALKNGGTPVNAIAGKVRIRPHLINNYLSQAVSFSEKQLAEVFLTLLKADTHLKTSYQRPALIMDLLVYKLCQPEGTLSRL